MRSQPVPVPRLLAGEAGPARLLRTRERPGALVGRADVKRQVGGLPCRDMGWGGGGRDGTG